MKRIYNPIAKSLKDARYRKRIVKSKVKYSRKLNRKMLRQNVAGET